MKVNGYVDRMAGEHAETLQVFLIVLKHRQQAVEIHHLPIHPLECQVLTDGGQTVAKDWQLKLRRGPVSSLPPLAATTVSGRNRLESLSKSPLSPRYDRRSSESRRGSPRARATPAAKLRCCLSKKRVLSAGRRASRIAAIRVRVTGPGDRRVAAAHECRFNSSLAMASR
jgi:hypothetical protein